MTDSIRIYRADLATYVDVGTWIDASKQVEFGDSALHTVGFQRTPYIEGGVPMADTSGERQMQFPLIVPSAFAGGLTALEGMLRGFAGAGGCVDILLDGSSTKYVRFNILSGKLVHDGAYITGIQRAARRRSTLQLTTEPFGYWPTQIILASTASVGTPGRIDLSGSPVIGDAPGLMQLIVSPTSPSVYAAGAWSLDTVLWSIAGSPSFQSFWPPASWAAPAAGSLGPDAFAPASQVLVTAPGSPTNWNVIARAQIPAALEPAYRGHYRAIGLFKGITTGNPWQLSIDSTPLGGSQGLASVGRVATFNVGAAGNVSPSPGFAAMDLGEIALPLIGSGYPQDEYIRVWAKAAAAGGVIQFGGLFLLAVDSEAGILPRGLTYPTIAGVNSPGRLVLTPGGAQNFVGGASSANLATTTPQSPLTYYRGAQSPQIGASAVTLDLMFMHRHPGSYTGVGAASIAATAPMAIQSRAFASVAVTYTPRWAFVSAENV